MAHEIRITLDEHNAVAVKAQQGQFPAVLIVYDGAGPHAQALTAGQAIDVARALLDAGMAGMQS